MATKQEALKVLFSTYLKLKQLYTQDHELQNDATKEDEELYTKVGKLYQSYLNKKEESPQQLIQGKNWENSTQQKVLDDLLTSSVAFQELLKGFSESNDFDLVFNVATTEQEMIDARYPVILEKMIEQFKQREEISELSEAEQQFLEKQALKQAQETSKRTFGTTRFAKEADGSFSKRVEFTIANEAEVVKLDADGAPIISKDGMKDVPLTEKRQLSLLGQAVTIIHESVHAAFRTNYPDNFAEQEDAEKQHTAMKSEDSIQKIATMIRAYADSQKISLAVTPLDEAELLAWYGLLRGKTALTFLQKYAQIMMANVPFNPDKTYNKVNAHINSFMLIPL